MIFRADHLTGAKVIFLTNHSAATSNTNITTTKTTINENNEHVKQNLMKLKTGSRSLLRHPVRKWIGLFYS